MELVAILPPLHLWKLLLLSAGQSCPLHPEFWREHVERRRDVPVRGGQVHDERAHDVQERDAQECDEQRDELAHGGLYLSQPHRLDAVLAPDESCVDRRR